LRRTVKRTLAQELWTLRPRRVAGSQREVRQEAGDEEEQRVDRQQVVGDAVDVLRADDQAEQADHGDADADQTGRDREYVLAQLRLFRCAPALVDHWAPSRVVERPAPRHDSFGATIVPVTPSPSGFGPPLGPLPFDDMTTPENHAAG